VAWVVILAVENARGVRLKLIRYGSQVAFIPIWFRVVPALEAASVRCGMNAPTFRSCVNGSGFVLMWDLAHGRV